MAALEKNIQDLFDAEFDIQLINLCTIDGFSIHSVCRDHNPVEADKVAAIASTLCSISNASAEQINKDEFTITTVESEKNAILFLQTQFLQNKAVLCVAVSARMPLGKARFHCQHLVKIIETIKNSD